MLKGKPSFVIEHTYMTLTTESRDRIVQGAIRSAALQKVRKDQRRADFTKTCLHCNSPMTYEKRHNKFCSKSCSASYNNQAQPKRTPEGVCARCGTPITSARKFCSSCWTSTPQKDSCVFCGKPRPPRNKTHCSKACQQQEREEHLRLAIENGEVHQPITLKAYLRRTSLHECAICHTTEWMGQPIPLTMDHIDGDPTNDRRENLRLICPNCDATLPTYAGRNRGNGRLSRRQRYAAGKSS